MSNPRFNPPRRDDTAQFASESRSGWLVDDSGQGSLETPHSTATIRIPRIVANLDSRTPAVEHGQQEGFEQYFRNTPLWTSATPQDHCNALFKGYPYRLTSTRTKSHRPRMRTFLVVPLAHL